MWIIRWLGKELAARTYSMGFGKAYTFNSTPPSDWSPSQWQDFDPWLWLCKLLPFTIYMYNGVWNHDLSKKKKNGVLNHDLSKKEKKNGVLNHENPP